MFNSYRNRYENVRMKREDGILEVALHTRRQSPIRSPVASESMRSRPKFSPLTRLQQ
jgi:hypothetical protein